MSTLSTSVLPGADDTIAAIATAPGRGAIALLRVSGRDAMAVAARVVPGLGRHSPRVAHLALIQDPSDGALLDEAIITAFPGPNSYTGEDVVELSVHGGAIVPSLVLSALITAGARQALPGEFTRRAVMNGRMDLLQAEAVGDLIDARSRMAHHVALSQLEGGLSRRASELRDAILELEALMAYDIDFPDEDEGSVDRQRVTQVLTRTLGALDDLLASGNTGEMVREGALVVIGGAPNAGKSSLFNALVGRERALVTDIAGTTRDAIEAVIDVHGWPVRLVDTAGLRDSTDVVERLGIEISERYLASADVVLLCAEKPETLNALRVRGQAITSAPVITVLTKADLGRVSASGSTESLRVSALTGEGLEPLAARIALQLSDRFGMGVSEAPLLTRRRHHEAVRTARSELSAFRDAWVRNEPPSSVAAIHLHQAAHHLGELIGSIDVEDILGRVFSTFCVGK